MNNRNWAGYITSLVLQIDKEQENNSAELPSIKAR